MKNFNLIILCVLFLSCSLFGATIAKKEKVYEISHSNEIYVFKIIDIQHNRTEFKLFEKIEYKLHKANETSDIIHSSFVEFTKKKDSKRTYERDRDKGSDIITYNKLSFRWSYCDENSIYLYLDDGTEIKEKAQV